MLSEHQERLSRFITKHLPTMVNMGAEIESYNDELLRLKAPLILNDNDKGTAFGGSLYCLTLLNAIGLVYLKCFENNINPNIVVSKADINYLRPVTDDVIVSHCEFPGSDVWSDFFQRYASHGKASMQLVSRVFQDDDEAVVFNGRFSLIGESNTTL